MKFILDGESDGIDEYPSNDNVASQNSDMIDPFFGSEQVFNSGSTNFISAVVLDSTHICVSYTDGGNSAYGTSIIGTISGNSISWNTASVFNAGYTSYISAMALDSTHICVSYRNDENSYYGTSIIGTVSGSNISWGTASVFNFASTNEISAVVLDNTHICVSYQDGGNSNYGTSIIGTVSGNSISWGSASVFNAGWTQYISAVTLDSIHICVSYRDDENSYYGTSIIGTISGNSISWGTKQVFNSVVTDYISAVALDSTHICVSYRELYYGTSIIGTISGNSISWGTKQVFSSVVTDEISAVTLDSTHICVSYSDTGNSIIGTISGNSISWSTKQVFNSTSINFISTVALDSTHICVSYQDYLNSGYGISIIQEYTF